MSLLFSDGLLAIQRFQDGLLKATAQLLTKDFALAKNLG